LKTTWSAPAATASPNGVDGDVDGTPGAKLAIPWAGDGAGINDQEKSQGPAHSGPSVTSATTVVDSSDSEGVTDSMESYPEAETDSPLDNANFLSFEEWKKKNLAKVGQSPENVGHGRSPPPDSNTRRRPVNVNALDSFGEDGEIELDFSGFGNKDGGTDSVSNPSTAVHDSPASEDGEEGENKVAPSSWALSKDAGKTCKERFNYASFDCAATVLKTNPKARSTSSILVENKDSYMLNECSIQNKYLIVELCDDILVDTVVLANFEFFSSIFRHFRVSVSDRYPVKLDRWKVLGTFEGRNTREIQPFLITEPQIWARYLRIEFLTHYGNEFYCPVSLLRVHGTTMMEQFKREEEEARGEDEFVPIESAEGESIVSASSIIEDGKGDDSLEAPPSSEKNTGKTEKKEAEDNDETSPPQAAVTSNPTVQSKPQEEAQNTESIATISEHSTGSISSNTKSRTSREGVVASKPTDSDAASTGQKVDTVPTESTQDDSMKPASSNAYSTQTAVSSAELSSVNHTSTATSVSSQKEKASSKGAKDETANGSTGASTNNTQAPSQQRASSPTQPNPSSPTTQESFFKSVHKRLQQLEVNSTLSLQYIEEQSRILRDAFVKVEKRQLSKIEAFLVNLNGTVISELKTYRGMYEQLWQSTILELEGMKERNQREIGEIGARLSLVADELVWQKRMAVVQSTLLLLCLGLVLFVRSGNMGSQLDVPIVQQLSSRYNRMFDTPPGSPDFKGRKRGIKKMWRSDTSGYSERSGHQSDGINHGSDVETDGIRSPVQMVFSPPTPTTAGTMSEAGHGYSPGEPSPESSTGRDEEEGKDGVIGRRGEMMELDEQAERVKFLTTHSGPATPRGSRDSRPSWEVDAAGEGLPLPEEPQSSPPPEQQSPEQSSPEMKREKRKTKRRSPLRRMESYGAGEGESPADSPGDDSGADGLFVGG